MKKILILTGVIIFSLISCTTIEKEDNGYKNITNIKTIYGKEFKLDYSNITIVFEENKVYGLAGINRYFTSYDVNKNGTVSFKPIATTLMAGAPELMERERKYLKFLSEAFDIKVLNEEKIQIISKDEVLNFSLNK